MATKTRTLKVSIPISVEIDVDAWRTEYGLETVAEVREDVKRHVANAVTWHLAGLGLLAVDDVALQREEALQQQDESAPFGYWICPTCKSTFPADQIERHQEWHEWI